MLTLHTYDGSGKKKAGTLLPLDGKIVTPNGPITICEPRLPRSAGQPEEGGGLFTNGVQGGR